MKTAPANSQGRLHSYDPVEIPRWLRGYPPGASSVLPSSFLRGRSRTFSPLSVAPTPSAAAVPVDPPAGAAPDPGSVEMVDVSSVVVSSIVASPDVTPDGPTPPVSMSLGAGGTGSAGGAGNNSIGILSPLSTVRS